MKKANKSGKAETDPVLRLRFIPAPVQVADRSAEALVEAVRRIVGRHTGARLTRAEFDRLAGRMLSATVVDRLGSWKEGLERAGFGHLYAGSLPGKRRHKPGLGMSEADRIADVLRVRALTGRRTVSRTEYERHGRACASTLVNWFGSWVAVLKAAGLQPEYVRRPPYADDELHENLAAVCAKLGRWPRAADMRPPLSPITEYPYVRRWGSWRKALVAFAARAEAENQRTRELAAAAGRTPEAPDVAVQPDAAPRPFRRAVPPAVRFAVYERDGYRCRICGARPGPDRRVALEIDHIVPVSKGGSSEMDNLQTVCMLCNRGKGALDLREPPAPPRKKK